jgi:hypothetical protein
MIIIGLTGPTAAFYCERGLPVFVTVVVSSPPDLQRSRA